MTTLVIEIPPRIWHHLADLTAALFLGKTGKIKVRCTLPFGCGCGRSQRCLESKAPFTGSDVHVIAFNGISLRYPRLSVHILVGLFRLFPQIPACDRLMPCTTPKRNSGLLCRLPDLFAHVRTSTEHLNGAGTDVSATPSPLDCRSWR